MHNYMYMYSKSTYMYICIRGGTQELTGLHIKFYDTHDTVLSTENKIIIPGLELYFQQKHQLRSMIRTGQLEMSLAFRRICIAMI